MKKSTLFPVMLAGAGLVFGLPAWAGPPAICHAIEIGQAKSLPWRTGSDFNLADPAYDLSRLTTDTLALLAPATPIRVRMETLRRAAIYSARDTRLSFDLATRLMARALDSESAGKPEAMAWFDAGYFVETLKQAALVYKWNMLSPSQKQAWTLREEIAGIDGFRWVLKAMRTGGESEDFRYALSLIDFERERKQTRAAR
ncbi:MAG: hypothetical protein WD696_18900 [Bryobacteraceae bacterium]